MPPLTQFDPQLAVVSVLTGAGDVLNLVDVGGPLTLDDPTKYAVPIAIHFTIVQTKKDVPEAEKHKRENSNFVYGCTEVTDLARQRWDKQLEVKQGTLHDGEARGIAVAVFPIKDDFTYETLTWCGHITLTLRAAQEQPSSAS
jgi:hypothetical protein